MMTAGSGAVARLLSRLDSGTVFVLCAVLVVLVGWVDYATGIELSFSIFYLLPIAVGAWRLGSAAGIGLSLASAAA